MDTVVLTSARGLRRLYQLFNKFIKIPKKIIRRAIFAYNTGGVVPHRDQRFL
jgi:hypothetical protein